MPIEKQRLLNEFTNLVAIDNPSCGEKQMGDYLKQCLLTMGFTVEQDAPLTSSPKSCGNIHGFLKGDGQGTPILFCAHMDAIEPSCGKRAVVCNDGIIRSAGDTVLGADDCAGIAAILEALCTISAEKLSHRPIEVLFTVAEELYCKGAEIFDFSTVQAKEAYVLDLTGPVGTAAYQAPTILSFKVEVIGKAAHAGFAPEDGIHAISVAAVAIDRLRMGRIDEDTTLNIGLIEGGTATNIVPQSCIITGEIRSYSHPKALQQAEKVKECFQKAAEEAGAIAQIRIICCCEGYEIPLCHPVVSRFQTACEKMALEPVLCKTFGGSDNNHLAKHGISGIVLANAMFRCHSCEEYTTVEELCRIAELTLLLMTM